MRKKILSVFLGAAFAAAVLLPWGLWIAGVASAQENEISKEEFLDFQGQWFDYMDRRGMNPGEMMGGQNMDKSRFMEYEGKMYDIMQEYGLDPALMMKNCLCAGMMQKGAPQMQ